MQIKANKKKYFFIAKKFENKFYGMKKREIMELIKMMRL